MTAASLPSSPRWSIPAFVLGSLAVIGFLVLLNPPVYQPSTVEPRTEAAAPAQGGADADTGAIPGLDAARIQVVPAPPTIVVPVHRANRVLMLQLGPDDRYVTVGQVASGARVEVVGRNEKGDWLAISLNPGARTYGWARAVGISGLTAANIAALPVAPVVRTALTWPLAAAAP